MSVVDELFNIFTHYALIGDPHDPEHIKATHFQKFARDCQMLPTPAIQQKLHILFKHLLAKQARKREGDGAPESPRASPVARPAPLRSPSRRLSMSEKAAAATAAANESRAQQAASASALSLTRLDFHGFLDLLNPANTDQVSSCQPMARGCLYKCMLCRRVESSFESGVSQFITTRSTPW